MPAAVGLMTMTIRTKATKQNMKKTMIPRKKKVRNTTVFRKDALKIYAFCISK